MIRINPDCLITPGVRRIFRAFRVGGATARLVGGCVRDALLRNPPGDRDLAVDVPPHDAMRLLRLEGIAVKPIGIAYGSILALPPEGGGYDVTSLRRDIESDGRHPVVQYGTNWTEDARRRDFTMNALYAGEDGQVFDPIGGIGDLLSGKVRFIGRPADRVREDHLRILRFFRFHAWYGTERMDAAGLKACAEAAARIAGLSRERIGNEMRLLLLAPDPVHAIEEAQEAGVLSRVLPGAQTSGLDRLVQLEGSLGLSPSWERRWLLLCAGFADQRSRPWPLSRTEERGLRSRLNAWAADAIPMEAARRWGTQAAEDAMLVRAARGGWVVSETDLADARSAAEAVLPVCAADLIAAGAPVGPEVGRALRRAERHWLLQKMRAGRDELIRVAVGNPHDTASDDGQGPFRE